MVPLSNDQLSSIAGYMSLACWVVVFTPQIWENYQLQSGEGLSVTFIVLWLLGDITNLFGGLLANLLPTIVVIAVYYSVSDLVLLFQVYYYRYRRSKTTANTSTSASTSDSTTEASESSPLLSPADIPPHTQPRPLLPPGLEYPLLLLFVLGAGVGAWYLSPESDDVSIPEKPGKGGQVALEWKSQTLGWASAVLYLGSRVPQISHNFKTRCAGLSLAMFFFSISGNITYVFSIMLTSLDSRYLIANLPWLVGSGATVFLDLFVLGQFAVFSWQDRQAKAKVFVDDEGEAGGESV